MTSFFAEFVHTDKNVTCSDTGLMDFSTGQECYGAVNYAKTFNSNARYRWELYGDMYPKGCFISESGNMYFNKYTGSARSSFSGISICYRGNK